MFLDLKQFGSTDNQINQEITQSYFVSWKPVLPNEFILVCGVYKDPLLFPVIGSAFGKISRNDSK